MADDIDDIEDLLEAPYKNAPSQDAVKNGNGLNHEHTNGNKADSEKDDIEMKETEKHNDSQKKSSDQEKQSKHDSDSKKEVKKSRKDRSRSKSRSRSRSRSKHRRRSRSRSRTKRSKRSRSRDRDRRRRSRSRDRDRSRDKKRSRSRSRSKRRRSRSRSKTRSRSRSYTRTRSRSRDEKRHKRSKDRSRDRSRRRSRSVRREKSPDLTPEERDQRTVFCMQLSARIRPRDLEEFFTAVGKVKDVRLITDPRTKRSKGIAYIEFKDIESVPLAIALTGQRLLGVPIIVKLTQAEKNRMPFTGPHIPANLPQEGPIKLYVGSLHVNITEEMLRGIFEPFGTIDVIALARDDFGRSKGYGFIQFANAEDGKKAMEQLNNFELASRPIKVSLFISEKAFDTPTTVSTIISNLDNDELDRSGVPLGPSGKLALMAKLAEGTGLKVPQQTLDALNMTSTTAPVPLNGSVANGTVLPPAAPLTSQCFILSNMFDLEEEKMKENWVEEIRDDVIDECNKYGGLVHIHIDQNSPDGRIYIKCPTIGVATSVMSALSGRYFSGKLIQANYIPIANYNKQFPESVNSTQLLTSSS